VSGTVQIVAVDPSLARTGIAVLECPAVEQADRLVLAGGSRRIVALLSGGERADGGLSWLFVEATTYLTLGIPWIGVVERPPPTNKGQGRAPTVAERDALRWLDQLARERARALGRRFLTPTILRPRPGEWRAPLGLATRAPRGSSAVKRERADWLKAQAMRLAETELRERGADAAALNTDSAEALCLGLWAIRCVGVSGTWCRAGAKPVALRATA
jgi:hypothetical protein